MPRRKISDNIPVAYEVIHFLRRKNKGNQGFMSLKLDISKAYDHIECKYLDCILRVLVSHFVISIL